MCCVMMCAMSDEMCCMNLVIYHHCLLFDSVQCDE